MKCNDPSEYKKDAKVTSSAICSSKLRSKVVDNKVSGYSQDINGYKLVLKDFFQITNTVYYYNLSQKDVVVQNNCDYAIIFDESNQPSRNFSLFSNENNYEKLTTQYRTNNKNPQTDDYVTFYVRSINSNNFPVKNVSLNIKEVFDLNFEGELVSLILQNSEEFNECGSEPNVKKYPADWTCCLDGTARQESSQCDEPISIKFNVEPNSHYDINLTFKVTNPPDLPFITGEPSFITQDVIQGQTVSKGGSEGLIVGKKIKVDGCDNIKFTTYGFTSNCCDSSENCESNELCCDGVCQECCDSGDCPKYCSWVMGGILEESVGSIEGCEYQNDNNYWICQKIVEKNEDEDCFKNTNLMEYRDLVVSAVGYDSGDYFTLGNCCEGKCKTTSDICPNGINENCECIDLIGLSQTNIDTGSNVVVNFDSLSVTFDNVTESGVVAKHNIFSSQELGYYIYNISTTSEFTGDSVITITVPEGIDFNNTKIYQLVGNENLQIMQVLDPGFNDITITDGPHAPDPVSRKKSGYFPDSSFNQNPSGSDGTFVITPDGDLGGAEDIFNTTVSGGNGAITTLNPDGTVASINWPTPPPCPGGQTRAFSVLQGFGDCGCYETLIDIATVEAALDAITLLAGALKYLLKKAAMEALNKAGKEAAKGAAKRKVNDINDIIDDLEDGVDKLKKMNDFNDQRDRINDIWVNLVVDFPEKVPGFSGTLDNFKDIPFQDLVDSIGYDDAVWLRENADVYGDWLQKATDLFPDGGWLARPGGEDLGKIIKQRLKEANERLDVAYRESSLAEAAFSAAQQAFDAISSQLKSTLTDVLFTLGALHAAMQWFESLPVIQVEMTCELPLVLDELNCSCEPEPCTEVIPSGSQDCGCQEGETCCPNGCCPEPNWVCCPDGLYCRATCAECPLI